VGGKILIKTYELYRDQVKGASCQAGLNVMYHSMTFSKMAKTLRWLENYTASCLPGSGAEKVQTDGRASLVDFGGLGKSEYAFWVIVNHFFKWR
jgi:hypothetical protein